MAKQNTYMVVDTFNPSKPYLSKVTMDVVVANMNLPDEECVNAAKTGKLLYNQYRIVPTQSGNAGLFAVIIILIAAIIAGVFLLRPKEDTGSVEPTPGPYVEEPTVEPTDEPTPTPTVEPTPELEPGPELEPEPTISLEEAVLKMNYLNEVLNVVCYDTVVFDNVKSQGAINFKNSNDVWVQVMLIPYTEEGQYYWSDAIYTSDFIEPRASLEFMVLDEVAVAEKQIVAGEYDCVFVITAHRPAEDGTYDFLGSCGVNVTLRIHNNIEEVGANEE